MAVRSRDFKVDGMNDGRAETDAGMQSSAPIAPKTSLTTGHAITTNVPSVERTEDLGALFNLRLGSGDKKTVVVTFALLLRGALSTDQLYALRWSPEAR